MNNKEKLKKSFDYYLNNKAEFIKNPAYYGKYIVIMNEEVLEVYSTELDAINSMKEKGHELGDYVVQIVRENDGTKANFVSNVYV